MIGMETFLLGLLIVSTFTGLATEAVKKILTENNISYRANTLAGICALILSVVVGISYVLLTNSTFTTEVIIYIVGLVFMSWLCAMIGYDKVVQAISQFKTTKGDEDE